MKVKVIVSLLASALLGFSAPLVLAQEDDVPTIGGVSVTTAVAVGIVGATIIGASLDDDDSSDDSIESTEDTDGGTPTTGTTGT